jgi:hypothetical protein
MNIGFKNIFIIDWDDTLFPTTWVNNKKINIHYYANNMI